MTGIGILAYGSLISDPGAEIYPLIVRRINTTTPFPVEYARLSGTRGGASTVVPHSSGQPVKAEVLVLTESVLFEEAKNLLWRRETHKVGSDHIYRDSTSPNAVVIRDEPGFCGLNHILYTDFNLAGKLSVPDPKELAKAAVKSVTQAGHGKDGISYLMDLINKGVETALTPQYQKEILALTHTSCLADALASLRSETQGGISDGQS